MAEKLRLTIGDRLKGARYEKDVWSRKKTGRVTVETKGTMTGAPRRIELKVDAINKMAEVREKAKKARKANLSSRTPLGKAVELVGSKKTLHEISRLTVTDRLLRGLSIDKRTGRVIQSARTSGMRSPSHRRNAINEARAALRGQEEALMLLAQSERPYSTQAGEVLIFAGAKGKEFLKKHKEKRVIKKANKVTFDKKEYVDENGNKKKVIKGKFFETTPPRATQTKPKETDKPTKKTEPKTARQSEPIRLKRELPAKAVLRLSDKPEPKRITDEKITVYGTYVDKKTGQKKLILDGEIVRKPKKKQEAHS